MIDVVTVGAGGGSIAWLSPEGTLKVGPKSAGADPGPMCYPNGGDQPTVTDAHVTLGRIPPHLLGGEIPLSVEAAIDGLAAARREARPLARAHRHRHPRDLRVEPGQRAAPGDRRQGPRRPRLHAHHVRRLRLAAGLPADGHPQPAPHAGAAEPGQRQRVRAAHRRRPQRLRADRRLQAPRPRPRPRAVGLRRPGGPGAERPGRRGLRPRRPAHAADGGPALRRPGLRGARARSRDGELDRAAAEDVAQAFHAAHRQLYGYDFADRPAPGRRVGEPPGQRDRPDPPSRHGGAARRRTAGRTGPSRARAGSSSTTGSTPRPTTGPASPPATWSPARRSSRSSARPSRCTPASPSPSTPTATCCSRRSRRQ